MATSLNALAAIRKIISDALQYGYAEAAASQPIWQNDLLGPEQTTTQDTITFRWLQDRVGLREELRNDAPVFRRILGEKWEVPLRYWQNGLAISIYDIAADEFGQVQMAASQIGALIQRKPQDLMCEAFNDGDTAAFVMFDGQNLYSNAHPKGGTTFDNLLGPLALDLAGVQTVRTAMRRFPSDEGTSQPLDLIGNYLWHSVENELNAKFVLNNTTIASASSAGVFGTVPNPLQGIAVPITDGRIDDANDWGMVAALPFLKPFIAVKHATEGDPVLIAMDRRDGTNMAFVNDKEYQYFVRFGKNVVPTRPELHIKVVN